MKKPSRPRRRHPGDRPAASDDTEPEIAIGTIALGVAMLAILIVIVLALVRDAWVLMIALTQP